MQCIAWALTGPVHTICQASNSLRCAAAATARRGPRPADSAAPHLSVSRDFEYLAAARKEAEQQLNIPESVILKQMELNRQARRRQAAMHLNHQHQQQQPGMQQVSSSDTTSSHNSRQRRAFVDHQRRQGGPASSQLPTSTQLPAAPQLPSDDVSIHIPQSVFDSMAREAPGLRQGFSGSMLLSPGLNPSTKESSQQQGQHTADALADSELLALKTAEAKAGNQAGMKSNVIDNDTTSSSSSNASTTLQQAASVMSDVDDVTDHSLELLQAFADALDADCNRQGSSAAGNSHSTDTNSRSRLGATADATAALSTAAPSAAHDTISGSAAYAEEDGGRFGTYGPGFIDRLIALEDAGLEWGAGRLEQQATATGCNLMDGSSDGVGSSARADSAASSSSSSTLEQGSVVGSSSSGRKKLFTYDESPPDGASTASTSADVRERTDDHPTVSAMSSPADVADLDDVAEIWDDLDPDEEREIAIRQLRQTIYGIQTQQQQHGTSPSPAAANADSADDDDDDVSMDLMSADKDWQQTDPTASKLAVDSAMRWSRIIRPPRKRGGHVILDLCAPATAEPGSSSAAGSDSSSSRSKGVASRFDVLGGQLERHVVTRADGDKWMGRAGYRMARAMQWGDLWPEFYRLNPRKGVL